MRRARRWWPLALLAAGPAPVLAQSDAIARLEARAEAGDVAGVADVLRRWLDEASDPSRDLLWRARYLRARLTPAADSAAAELLSLALDGGRGAAPAWLRLAQLDVARGDPERAATILARLRAEDPLSAEARASWYWTARSLEDRGLLEPACEGWTRALAEARGGGDAATVRLAETALAGCAPGAPRYTVQVAAFAAPEAAGEMRSRLDGDGVPARVVEEGGLHRVRVGRFASPEAARGLERRLRLAGFSADIVAARP